MKGGKSMTRGTPIKKRKVMVMVNGLPGNMATKVLEHIKDADKEKYPFSLLNINGFGSLRTLL